MTVLPEAMVSSAPSSPSHAARAVVGEHGDDDVSAFGPLRWSAGDGRTLCGERLGFFACAVVDREGKAGLEEVGGHAATHGSDTEKSYALLRHFSQAPYAIG
jgi:hypothetical protein